MDRLRLLARPLRLLKAVALLPVLIALVATPTWAQSRPQDIELVKALRGGGHVILMRHFQAEPDGADRNPRDFKNIRQQQQLTETGRTAARVVGNWFKVIGLPLGEVVSSRFHRAQQSITLAGLGTPQLSDDATEGSLVETPNENRRRAKALRALLSAPMPVRQNRLIVTHRVSIQNALGKEWFDVKEGEASIFKIEGASYSLVARIQSDEWARLAAAAREIDRPQVPLDAPAKAMPNGPAGLPGQAPVPPQIAPVGPPGIGTGLPTTQPANGKRL